jgi:hypothetical protein
MPDVAPTKTAVRSLDALVEKKEEFAERTEAYLTMMGIA